MFGQRTPRGRAIGGFMPARPKKGSTLAGVNARSGNEGPLETAPSRVRSIVVAATNMEETANQAGEVSSLLHCLKTTARRLLPNGHASDHLVELTLARAAAGLNRRCEEQCLSAWLTTLLQDTYERVGPELKLMYLPQSAECPFEPKAGEPARPPRPV